MPRYKVVKQGFMFDRLYHPEHPRRHVLHSDKPLKPVPSWLKLMKDETPAEKKSRKKADAAKVKTDAEKTDQDKVDIDSVNFTEPSPGANVETL